jgi:hypothetical protein
LLVDWSRASSPSHVVAVDLQGKLLARERELNSQEGVIVAWEEGLVAFAHALGEVHVKRDASRADANAV